MRDECITNIVNTWYTILSSKQKELTKHCLKTMQNYIDWIDINLVVGENFMKLIFSFLSIPDFRIEACECLNMVSTNIMSIYYKPINH